MRSEAELMGRVAAGDKEAFESLVSAYWGTAHSAARAVLGDEALSEDAAQECFADLYMQSARYRPGFSLAAYVAAIARHKAADISRKRRLRPPAAPEGRTDTAESSEDAYIRGLYRRSLYAALERLPERQRLIVKAFAIEGDNYARIARSLGITTAQVRATLHRARRALRRVREEWDED